MNLPELPPNASRRDMRKAILRLRMEMHRQEIRHESQQLLQPLRRARGFTSNLSGTLGLDRAPAWGIAALAALGFLAGRRRGLLRLIRLGTLLYPLLSLALRRSSSPTDGKPPASS
ncbi:hypothetical protein [Zestomonas thermotolerans]|uniref:hypothetical protein n=1 Tax=Zestomonas thermotolerans TaxID=157784 RepID=UPI0023EFF693|nr:hypothetical protein [Pseudomonas thermotolerans]MBO2509976.1 hypothetical protein [Gammaproteobacteria bacterium]